MTSRSSRVLCAGLLLAGACGREPGRLTAPETAPPALVELTCTMQVRSAALSCEPATQSLASRVSGDLVLGGQGTNVFLASGTGQNIGGVLTVPVTVTNLIGQRLGTTDGFTLASGGVRVFFANGPNVTSGTGTVVVAVPSSPDSTGGSAVFLGSNEPYFQYNQVLAGGETSAPRTWRFNVAAGVGTYTFSVYVSAPVQYPDGWVALSSSTLSLAPGQTSAVLATPRDRFGASTGAAVTWTSDNPAVANVTPTGTVVAGVAGSTHLHASAGALSTTLPVSVSSAQELCVGPGCD